MKPYTITAKFDRKRLKDSDNDQPNYYVYEFSNVKNSAGKKIGSKWIKETRLMKAVSFIKGKQYNMELSSAPYSEDVSRLPFPKLVAWDKEKVYIKGGNSIIREDAKGNETKKNGGWSLSGLTGHSTYDIGALNKFGRGELDTDLLLKINKRGLYFTVISGYSKIRKMMPQIGHGLSSNKEKGNYVRIEKHTQKEIDEDLKTIFEEYVKKSIRKHFKIETQILSPGS